MTNKYNLTAIVKDKKGRVLSIGRNSYVKTHPLMAKAGQKTGENHRSYLHAEAAAILKIKDWTKAASIEIFRFKKDGSPGCAKPCLSCQYIINQTGILKVSYTT